MLIGGTYENLEEEKASLWCGLGSLGHGLPTLHTNQWSCREKKGTPPAQTIVGAFQPF